VRIAGPIVLYHPRDEDDAVFPLALLHVGSALRGQPVVLVDGRLDLAPEARVAGLAREALCLGVTVRTGRPLTDALRVTSAARTANPELPIFWGGPHPTFRPQDCLAPEGPSRCVVGWGERTLGEIVARLRAREPIEGVAGVAWRRGETVERETPRAREDVASLPPVDYGLLDLEPYFRWRDARRVDYCSSRGRPGSAAAPWSGLPVERVVEELAVLVRRHRLREVAFRDEDFFADVRRAEAIGRGLRHADLQVSWSGATIPATLGRLSPELLRPLASSGCAQVRVATPGHKVLDAEAKASLTEGAVRLHEAGIGGRFSFTVGAPGLEPGGLASIHRAARALRRIDRRFFTPIHLYAPYPGGEGPEPPGFEPPRILADWAEAGLEDGGFVARALARDARRRHFFLEEAYRGGGRRAGKHLLRLLARVRVLVGFYALDLDRSLVEWLARLRTGRPRRSTVED